MHPNTKAMLFEEGGKIASGLIRLAITRPRKRSAPEPEVETITQEPEVLVPISEEPIPIDIEATIHTKTPQEELDYRWECCMKHLGGASILLREAFERAIDEGIGEGTAEKIMEALNEHSGMEADIEKMLAMPEAKAQAEKLLSGVRAFRRASWEAKLPTGGGTKEDVSDARLWNDILYQESYSEAKKNPGSACIQEGM